MRFTARLAAYKIDNAGFALLVCSAGSVLVGACAFAVMMAAIGPFRLSDEIGSFIPRIFLASIASLILIFPAGVAFGFPTTWLARRYKVESLALYLAAGSLAGAACSLVFDGLPEGFPLAVGIILKICGPVFGGSWALLWWQTYRRWRANQRP